MKILVKSITNSEWRFVGWLALAIMLITALPYIGGYLAAPAGYVFDGIGSLTPADNPVYYSYLRQAADGAWTLKDMFTGEEQPHGLFNIFWLVAGRLAGLAALPPILAFHLWRLALIPVFTALAYYFISRFYAEIPKRRLALIFLLFSAGLGAYIIGPLSLFDFSAAVGYFTPNDIWIPESITFLTLYKTPHFIASQIFTLLIFLLLIPGIVRPRLLNFVGAGFLALAYFNFHPFYIPVIYGTVGLFLLWQLILAKRILWRPLLYFSIFVTLSSPAIFYHFYVLMTNPIMAARAWQNVTIAPPFFMILIGYGLLWPLALWGIYDRWRQKQFDAYFSFLACWLAISATAVILPSQFQSRYTQGLHLPLVIFAVAGWEALKAYGRKNRGRFGPWLFILEDKFLLTIIFILGLGFSNIFNVARDVYYYAVKPPAVALYFYVPDAVFSGYDYLAQQPPGTVLGSQMIVLLTPAYAAQPVFAAHPIETLDYERKALYVNWFFAQDTGSEKKYEWLKREQIKYIIFGPDELAAGRFKPETKAYLKAVYTGQEVKIFTVL